MLAQPVEIGLQRRDEPREAVAEAGAGNGRLRVEVDVIEVAQLLRDWRAGERHGDDGQDALRQPYGLADLPQADNRDGRLRRHREYDRLGLEDEAAEALLPVLAARDAVAVEDRLVAIGFERG